VASSPEESFAEKTQQNCCETSEPKSYKTCTQENNQIAGPSTSLASGILAGPPSILHEDLECLQNTEALFPVDIVIDHQQLATMESSPRNSVRNSSSVAPSSEESFAEKTQQICCEPSQPQSSKTNENNKAAEPSKSFSSMRMTRSKSLLLESIKKGVEKIDDGTKVSDKPAKTAKVAVIPKPKARGRGRPRLHTNIVPQVIRSPTYQPFPMDFPPLQTQEVPADPTAEDDDLLVELLTTPRIRRVRRTTVCVPKRRRTTDARYITPVIPPVVVKDEPMSE